ncbi:MAG: DUF177 domain-containing protein [Pseudolabrys sp.]|nr:DUF177 domain-containing protein [Pseudolabrys sp.]
MLAPAWSFPVVVADIPDEGAHFEISADDAERAGVAKLAGVRSVQRLAAVFDVSRRGAGVHIAGTVKARVEQTCVITLDPVKADVEEAVDLEYASAPGGAQSGRRKRKDTDPPETLENGIADLGAVATEFLILGLDPYPRAPGAEFSQPKTADNGAKPFAALEALKKRS